MSKAQILIVDDEWNMRNLLRIYLTKGGFEVQEAASGREAISLLREHNYDAVLLDIMLPDMDGWQVCRKIREIDQTLGILMLTARSETKDKVYGFGLGADDYLTKPFEPEELLARVQSLLRRSVRNQTAHSISTAIEFQSMRILPEAREIYILGAAVDFTQKEFDLLTVLAQYSQRAFSREELVDKLWGYDYTGGTRAVDTHVKNIREKAQRAGLPYNPIQTVWGIGYKFGGAGET